MYLVIYIGNFTILNKILNYYNYDDTFISLGDIIDRGLDGIKCLERVIMDPRITCLMGNHERMMLDGMLEYYHSKDMWCHDFMLWIQNGGNNTFQALTQLPKEHQTKILNVVSEWSQYTFYDTSNRLPHIFITCRL